MTDSRLFQWTIAKIHLEVESTPSELRHNKMIFEFEDLLTTLNQKNKDFTSFTNKIGLFNLGYFESKGRKLNWQRQESLRIKMLGDNNNLPFLNVVYTQVGLQNYYKKVGIKRKPASTRSLSEIIVNIEALEFIVDMHKLADFVVPICKLMIHVDVTAFSKSKLSNCDSLQVPVLKPLTSKDLPMIHLSSKGFMLYLPVESGHTSCSVMILKVEQIKITPNLQNPLQRKPVRQDVYGKAAQMGILQLPGSMCEDRQYELSFNNICMASGNWLQILTHMREQQNQSFHRTNPAFEWNNRNRKTALQLSDIFNNFNFVSIYAPCIVYQNVLICGQAIEFNCVSDFVASVNTYHLNLISCLILRMQIILK